MCLAPGDHIVLPDIDCLLDSTTILFLILPSRADADIFVHRMSCKQAILFVSRQSEITSLRSELLSMRR
jgi:hypothetical protein